MKPAHRAPFVAPLLLAMLAGAATTTRAENRAAERARRAVASGHVVPGRDLLPLVEELRRSRDAEERRELVDTIADLGDRRSTSPNAVKAYLLEEATPVLLEVAKNGHEPFLQGDAIVALREMGAPRAVLEQAAAIAAADPDDFVRSRGEILRNYIASLPAEDTAAASKPVDAGRAKAAIAYLDKLGVTVSTESLRTAARDANPEMVQALLDAGVAPDTGVRTLTETPLYLAVTTGCSSQGQETDWLVETVRHLVAAGADLTLHDDNNNTALTHAAHECGPRIVELLVAGGAKVSGRNGSGLSPLGMALVMGNLDAAEVLVKKGARLAGEELAMVKASVSDARGKALVRQASGGH